MTRKVEWITLNESALEKKKTESWPQGAILAHVDFGVVPSADSFVKDTMVRNRFLKRWRKNTNMKVTEWWLVGEASK